MAWLLFIGGLTCLLVGAEFFVRGSSRAAAAFGVPALVIGLTVVAFGTSAPEAAVGVQSALAGNSAIGIGNVIGSNIANVLLILGIVALVSPIPVSARVVRVDVPVMLGFSALLWWLCSDGALGRGNGLLLLFLAVVYNVWLVAAAREDPSTDEGTPRRKPKLLSSFGWIVAGLVGIVFGADWLVTGAVEIAEDMGLSELIIGLTVVAIGTSMPEVATSLVASARGEKDIAVGNAVGSNVFNILLVLGVTATLSPEAIPIADPVLKFDLPIMLAVSAACLPIFFYNYRIGRTIGAVFLLFYVAYLSFLVLSAKEHDMLATFEQAMTYFVLPLTAVTLCVVAYRGWSRRRSGQ